MLTIVQWVIKSLRLLAERDLIHISCIMNCPSDKITKCLLFLNPAGELERIIELSAELHEALGKYS